jgi:hypothetical protein
VEGGGALGFPSWLTVLGLLGSEEGVPTLILSREGEGGWRGA